MSAGEEPTAGASPGETAVRALQLDAASRVYAEQSLERPLRELPAREVLRCSPETPLAEALGAMHRRRVGSIVVVDAQGAVAGILTRHDVLERIALVERPLATPVGAVMTRPVHTIDAGASAEQAALLMSRHGIRHVPVLDGTRIVNLVSERDLFALQRLSLKQLSSELLRAEDRPALRRLAEQIPRFARNLLAQGVGARALTALVSHLNDALTRRLVEQVAAAHGLGLGAAAWLAFGSEGRGEQTIATDQDNGLVFACDDDPARERPRWLAMAREANAALADCGFPLCKGGVMASNPAGCLAVGEWRERFDHWIEHGAPADLLAASIYFDLRPVAGDATLGTSLRRHVTERARGNPRFARQLAENALARRPPLNWRGAIDADADGTLDLKLCGTAVFVDAARLYALAHGIEATGTRERLEAAGTAIGAPPAESASWVGAFEFLQMMRLRAQQDALAPSNRVALAALSDLDRRMLLESLRAAKRLQQRVALDYLR